MNITVWGINYEPEPTGIGPFNTDMCAYLASQGHAVSMLTSFPYYPSWRKRPEDEGKTYERTVKGGITVHRCWHYVPSRPSTFKRLWHELSFVATTTWRALREPAADIYFVVSPPLFLGLGAFLVSRLKRRPYVLHVQDLQPDAALGLGMIKPGLATQALYLLEKFNYRNAALVTGITGGIMAAFRRKGISEEKTYLFANWIPDAPPSTAARSGVSFRAAHGIAPDQPLLAYSGNIGQKQGLDVVVEAAARAEAGGQRMHWAICGDGAARPTLQQQIEAAGVQGAKLYPLQPDDLYHSLLREADVCLITQQRGTGQFFFPSKLLSILQYGRPVLAVADETSELARAVHEGGFGTVVPCSDPVALREAAIMMVNASAEQKEAWSRNGLSWVSRFRRSHVLGAFEHELERLVTEPAIAVATA